MKFEEEAARELAKCIVLRCLRNTELENIHAGKGVHSETGDYSDVYVVTPAGNIPWNEVSKISDEQMRALMKEAVDKTYTFLMNMHNDDFLEKSLDYSKRRTQKWDEPELAKKF